jgi:hypothetical protein
MSTNLTGWVSSFQLHDATQPKNNMTATATTSLCIGDSVRLSTPWSDGSIVSYWAKCYRIADDGRAAIIIPAKVMALKFPPFPKDRMLIKNEIPESCIKRA